MLADEHCGGVHTNAVGAIGRAIGIINVAAAHPKIAQDFLLFLCGAVGHDGADFQPGELGF